MEKNKSTRRALTASIISLLVCVTMLIGTTFAWFTDTATASVNKIESGTLKIELVDENDQPLTNALQWVKAAGHEDEAVLWEPGATYQLQGFKVKNAGKLAAKYKIEIAGVQSGEAELLKVLQFSYQEGDNGTLDLDAEHHLAAGESSELITLSATMDPNAGNEYQEKTVDGIMIKVVATQDTVEFDSTTDQYDKDAIYPVLETATVKAGEDTVLKDKEVDHNVKLTVPADAVTEDTALELVVETATTPAAVTVSDTQSSDTYEVTLKNQATGETITLTDGNLIEVEMFVGKGRENLKVYHKDTLMTDDGASLSDTADHFVYDKNTGYVTMKVSSFSPFSVVYDKGEWSDNAAEEYATPIENNTVTIASAEELALFAKQVTDENKNYSKYTVKLTSDIDLGDYLWKPIKGNGKMQGITIDGQGHTISNMLARGCTNLENSGYGAGFIGDTNGSITIKNITFDRANVRFWKDSSKNRYGNVGSVIMGYTYGTTLFENVSVTNSDVWGYGKIGILLGMGADPGVSVTFKNCVSSNNTIHGSYNLGGLAGNIQRSKAGADNGKVEGCTVENITVDYDSSDSHLDLVNVTATMREDDRTGNAYTKTVSGKYAELWQLKGYFMGGYGDYYISYGDSSYDAPITDLGETNTSTLVAGKQYYLGNSEYPVGK